MMNQQTAQGLLGKGGAGLFRQSEPEEAVCVLGLAQPLGVPSGKAQALYVATAHLQPLADAFERLFGLPQGLEKL